MFKKTAEPLFTEPFKPPGGFNVVADNCAFSGGMNLFRVGALQTEQWVLRDDLLILVSSWDLMTVENIE